MTVTVQYSRSPDGERHFTPELSSLGAARWVAEAYERAGLHQVKVVLIADAVRDLKRRGLDLR